MPFLRREIKIAGARDLKIYDSIYFVLLFLSLSFFFNNEISSIMHNVLLFIDQFETYFSRIYRFLIY